MFTLHAGDEGNLPSRMPGKLLWHSTLYPATQVRLRLGALGRAFSRRSEQTRVSHEAHQIALATFGLTDALATVSCTPPRVIVGYSTKGLWMRHGALRRGRHPIRV